jgi:hypothetical protein
MRHPRLVRPVLAALCCTLLLTWLPSCDSVDEFIEQAGDAVKDVGGFVKDAADEAKEHLPQDSPGTGGPTANRPPRPTGTITTGPSAMVASQVIDANGGTVRVDKPGEPLDGLELTVPAGAYSDTRQFNISHAPVNEHTFGQYFNPATPLVIVENGGEYSSEPMTMRIPVDIPPNHFAMAFYYDDEKGTLEGIPFSSIESDSITIVTSHFCTLLVSIINNTLLDDLLKTDIDSHFRPGIDDWQFPNYGTWSTPNGKCAGHALSELWYFCEQPDGVDRTLYGRYDRNGVAPATPELWQDDSLGIRLASRIQGLLGLNWSSTAVRLMRLLTTVSDELTFKAFAYTIQLTGEPQYVGISSSAGGAHAMVCYRVHHGNLYIADPNYPGNTERRIEFKDGALRPYNSAANAADIAAGNGQQYETIRYGAKTAFVDWKELGQRWQEFKSGNIGWDIFPQYQLLIGETKDQPVPLTDGFKSPSKKILLGGTALCPIGVKVYRDGTLFEPGADGMHELYDGDNLLGFEVYGDRNHDPQNRAWEYIDFVYVNVTYGDQECRGWVLESVTTRNAYLAEENEGWQDLTFTSSDGRFTGSGRYRLYHDVNRPGDDRFATTSSSGTWTALPQCIKADTPAAVQVQLSSSVVYDPMESYHWSPDFYLIITGPMAHEVAFSQNLNHVQPTAQQSEEAIIQIPAGTATWNTTEVIVRIGCPEGNIDYVYTYVWRG